MEVLASDAGSLDSSISMVYSPSNHCGEHLTLLWQQHQGRPCTSCCPLRRISTHAFLPWNCRRILSRAASKIRKVRMQCLGLGFGVWGLGLLIHGLWDLINGWGFLGGVAETKGWPLFKLLLRRCPYSRHGRTSGCRDARISCFRQP